MLGIQEGSMGYLLSYTSACKYGFMSGVMARHINSVIKRGLTNPSGLRNGVMLKWKHLIERLADSKSNEYQLFAVAVCSTNPRPIWSHSATRRRITIYIKAVRMLNTRRRLNRQQLADLGKLQQCLEYIRQQAGEEAFAAAMSPHNDDE